MPRSRYAFFWSLVIWIGVTVVAGAQVVPAKKGMVATVNPVATQAALNAFREGGNAVDAAVAAALTLGVVDGHNSGLGGGCFVLIRTANGEVKAVDGREMAPAAATHDMFLRNGKAVAELSTTGPLASGIPGALAAYHEAITNHGSLKLPDLLNRAAIVADEGFAVDRVYARNLLQNQETLARFPATRKMLLKPNGEPYAEGEILKLPDLADSYRAIAKHGIDWFYSGEFSSKAAAWMSSNGGLLTTQDFANYQVKPRKPIESSYRGYTIIGFPPPSSGGIHVAQILNILEHFDLRNTLSTDPATANHVIVEAMKLAFADRAHWLGDADFAKVPRGLTDKSYAKQLAKRISLNAVTAVPSHSLPADWETNVFGKHTTHIATADAEGNWVAITATVNTSFGSKVVIPGTGIVLNNEMDDFSAQPGVPNAFGLVGAQANAVAPGKRPLSSMSPTIVLKDGKPVLTVGAAGGPKIITQVLLAIIRYIDADMPVYQCVAQPRIHHQWRPNRVLVEEAFDADVLSTLRKRGHEIELIERSGVCQAIAQLPNKTFVGVADPRVPGQAAGY